MQSVTHEIESSNEQDTWGVHQLETATGENAWGNRLLHKKTRAININWLQNNQSPGNIKPDKTNWLIDLTYWEECGWHQDSVKLKGNVNLCPIGTN